MCQSCCQEHLYAVRDESLHAARESVEDACGLSVVDSELVAYLLGDISHGKNRYGIVGRTEVDERH